MKLSTRSVYGLRALVELGLAAGRGPVSAASIAGSQALSVAYLEQLLHRLKKQGLILSTRGPKGGYLLAKDAEEITVAEIVRVLDGSAATHNGNGLSAVPPARAARSAAGGGMAQAGKRRDRRHIPTQAQRIAHAVFRCLHERLARALEAVTLQDVCREVREEAGEPLDHRYVFHI